MVTSQDKLEMIDPEDNFMYCTDYVAKRGGPSCNSLGHTRQTVRGKEIVLIPGERIGKIRRSSALMADIVQTIGDEDGCLTGEGELESMQAGIMSGFNVASTGVYLESLLVSV